MGEKHLKENFGIRVGGYMGASFSVEKEGSELIYKVFETGYSLKETITITPSEKVWDQFWESCDRLEIWDWEESYDNPDILDGTSWGVGISHDSKTVDSSGVNASPKTLDEFFKTVSKLLGGVDFY